MSVLADNREFFIFSCDRLILVLLVSTTVYNNNNAFTVVLIDQINDNNGDNDI